MSRMTRPESQARTRADLARTARDLFIADGMANTSLARVAEAAGYSKGAVYSNFRNKNELCLEVLELIHTEALAEITAVAELRGSAEDRIAALTEWARKRIDDVGFTQLEFELTLTGRDDPPLRDQIAANLAAVRSAIGDLLAGVAGSGSAAFLADTAQAVFSMGLGLSIQRTIDPTISTGPVARLLPALLDAAAATELKNAQPSERPSRNIEKRSNRRGGTARSDESRTALLAAAIEVFGSKRFDEVSTTEIAQRAGTAIGLINYHFGGKRGLYLAAADAVYSDFWDELQALRGPAVPRLIRGLNLYIDQAETREGSPLALSTQVTDEELRAMHHRHIDRFVTAMMQELTGGAGTPLARTAVAGWMAFVEGAVADWLRTRDISRVQLRELLVASLYTTGQSILALDPGTPLSSRAINALLEHAQPSKKTEPSE
ncbi:TetR family transcriptional regulator [Nocardia sp. NPDC052112]|uniref:TetR/AcrR family transcriptional regulator n=1 Tax=Nocardia sp. NPDC052112 TaxID=3155646 RepID=UPI003429F061